MRKLIIPFTATLTVLLFVAFFFQSFNTRGARAFTDINVDHTVTTSTGCSVRFLVNLQYTTPPLVVTWGGGSFRLTGNCGTNKEVADLVFTIVTDASGRITDIRWNVPEDHSLETILSNPEVEDAFKAYLQTVLI